MTIDDLVRIVPRPAAPYHADRAMWDKCQQELGLKLPQDWAQLGSTYGSGYFVLGPPWCVCIYNPLSPLFVAKLRAGGPRQNFTDSVLEYFVLDDPAECARRLAIYPKEGGDVPLGEDNDEKTTLWLRTELYPTAPDKWSIVVWQGWRDDDFAERYEFPPGLIQFLVRWFTRQIMLPGEGTFPRVTFVPDAEAELGERGR